MPTINEYYKRFPDKTAEDELKAIYAIHSSLLSTLRTMETAIVHSWYSRSTEGIIAHVADAVALAANWQRMLDQQMRGFLSGSVSIRAPSPISITRAATWAARAEAGRFSNLDSRLWLDLLRQLEPLILDVLAPPSEPQRDTPELSPRPPTVPRSAPTSAPPASDYLGEALFDALQSPDQSERERERRDNRVADFALARMDENGRYKLLGKAALEQALASNSRYRLRVHIGSPNPRYSAVQGPVVSVDEILGAAPDDKPRAIDVTVFPKRFRLRSPSTITLSLPPAGPTKYAYFDLITPEEEGICDLRIALYWQNNLIQSFTLTTGGLTGASGEVTKSQGTIIKMTSSGLESIQSIRNLHARALSIALNHDVNPGSHTVMIKGSNWSQQVQLNSAAMTRFMDNFRAILQESAEDPNASFKSSLLKLAQLGSKIWERLSLNSADTRLHDLKTNAGETVQFVRHGDAPFPWQVVYDYVLPEGEDFLRAEVCLAGQAASPDWTPGMRGCPHCPGKNVVCIEGFWSARHRIELISEEFGAGGTPEGRCVHTSAQSNGPLVLSGIADNSLASSDFAQALANRWANDVQKIAALIPSLQDRLWNPGQRPAVLLLLSHLYPEDDNRNVPSHMLAIRPEIGEMRVSARWLSQTRSASHPRWEAPYRPVVLLMACQSARTRLGELTNLVDAFLATGAAAVAGTEWNVLTSQAAAFATHLLEKTLGRELPLGEAVRSFVIDGLRNQDISPFVFTVYGNADLTIGRT
ncbi:hypothetical protein JOD97_001119 [Duganella sp. 1411]|uniref:CHAT domain-containing protein n=1 Tax=Duganella sp. 1411 TaxID=2806572 RepID=UPI001AE93913|nr:CHAT domain-containing protein [Duganella sp. 1411]MBP1203105.1 hypothetical protein [Duganella sp. 1411]